MPFDAVAVTVGEEPTEIAMVCVPVHPLAPVPVTVYVVVDAGVTVTLVPLNDPGIQLYVDAPLPVNVVLPPVQIEVVDALIPTAGAALTVTACVAVAVQPLALVPVTVYVVVTVGVTVTGDPLNEPGIHE